MNEEQVDALFARYVEHLFVNGAPLDLEELATGDAEVAGALRERVLAFQRIDDALGRELQPLSGRTLGRYEIHEKLGAGGMGDVYRALDKDLGRDVAVKVLPPLLARDPGRRTRFEREARILATLDHRNIAAIHGLERAEGVLFLVLELVPGETLQERAVRGPLPLEEALLLFRQIALALEAAHAKGIVHRDLKPANVKATPDGTVKLLDFGLGKTFGAHVAVEADDAREASPAPETIARSFEQTVTGLVLGTAAYMSPEQAQGVPVDQRTDIFSFGVLFQEMLTGKNPFTRGTSAETRAAILGEAAPSLSASRRDIAADTLSRLQSVLDQCLAKDPADRHQRTTDLLVDLEGIASQNAAPTTAAAAARRRLLVTASGVGLLLAGALAYQPAWRNEPIHLPDEDPLAASWAASPAALDAYLRGSLEARKLTSEGLRGSIRHFERAIAIEPSFAAAQLGRARSWLQLSSFQEPPLEAMPRARASAQEALAREPKLAEAHVVLAAVALYYDWDWIEAENSLQRALELNPRLAAAHSLYGNYLISIGRPDEALRSIQRAQILEPRSVVYHFDKVWALLTARRYPEALIEGRRAISFDPDYALGHSILGLAEALNGHRAAALRTLETAVSLEDGPVERGFLALGHALAGSPAEARAQLAKVKEAARTRYVCAYEVASVEALLGQHDEAFEWFERGVNERCECMVWYEAEPWLEPIRSDPRFAALHRKFGSLSRRPRGQ
jgi:tetratricopeptide (TPR) repeat protein/tRNA A-37 threonylcarbamoyl transferase component Bud32